MKTRNIAIMMFCFFACAAVLVALNIRAKMNGNDLESQWESTIEDLYDSSSTAYIHSMRYGSYARQAAIENDHARKSLFLALAYSEQVHEQMCARAAQLFGGNYTPPYYGADISTTTNENLSRSIASAHSRHRLSQGSAATRALKSGNRYAARILIWIDGSNRRHIELLEHSQNQNPTTSQSRGYLVCPKCGNIYRTSSYDIYCPFCQTHYSDFKQF